MRLHVVVCCLALAACTEGTKPESGLVATYRLALVNDRGVPAVIAVVGLAGTEHRVSAGELRFEGGHVIERTEYDSKPRNGEPTPTYSDSTRSTFVVKGSSILITRRWREDSTTIDTAFVEGDLLVMGEVLKSSLNIPNQFKHTLKFERVP